MVTKLPFTVMALGVDCSEGDVMPPLHPYKGTDDRHKKVSEGPEGGRCACVQLEGDPGLVHGEPPEALTQGGLPPPQQPRVRHPGLKGMERL